MRFQGKRLPKDVHAVILSNKTLYLLDVLQKLPIDKMNSLNIHQEILMKMSDIISMAYREYAGAVFKSQKLINQLKDWNNNIDNKRYSSSHIDVFI